MQWAITALVLLFVLPVLLFWFRERFTSPGAGRRERHSVYWTNLAILFLASGMSWAFGVQTYLLLQLTIRAAPIRGGVLGTW